MYFLPVNETMQQKLILKNLDFAQIEVSHS